VRLPGSTGRVWLKPPRLTLSKGGGWVNWSGLATLLGKFGEGTVRRLELLKPLQSEATPRCAVRIMRFTPFAIGKTIFIRTIKRRDRVRVS
jgi:hypothetical protein